MLKYVLYCNTTEKVRKNVPQAPLAPGFSPCNPHFLDKNSRQRYFFAMEVRAMEFGDRIKTIRKQNKLTQEQFAEKLNVTRQAVSNWENNKNLPDIGMLIRISDVFGISLDELIKGESTMKEKIIKDGSETRRAKFNMISIGIGAGLILFGIILILIKGASVEYIDAEGFLHENFFLLPLGFLSMFCGLLAFLTAGVRSIIHRIMDRKRKSE